jgi:DnaK suppressor protein
MKDKDLIVLKDILTLEIQKVSAYIKENFLELKGIESNLTDSCDEASANEDRDSIKSKINRRNKLVVSMKNTLAKIEQNKYHGDCEECGFDIPIERIKIVPSTNHCADCFEFVEKAG